jgi:peptidoglycan/LPS O-acetylase OafA/YrhL
MRAISALLVLLFHFKILSFGWAGVEVFFVLSGFLITRILIDSAQEESRLSGYLGRFYWRRSLRIFPLYYAVLLVIFAWILFHGQALDGADLARATYTYNWYRASHQYSDPSPASNHFWSLASEEQFYLVWPFLVYFLVRRGWLRKFVILLVICGSAVRFIACWIVPAEHVRWIVYHASVFQLGPLATGAAIACGAAPRIGRAWIWAMGFALVALTFGAVTNGPGSSFGFMSPAEVPHHAWLWSYTAVDLVSAALVIACVQDEWVVRVLDWRPLMRLGRVSYGFYVFHIYIMSGVILVAHRLSLGNRYSVPVSILLTWVAAEISFIYFESRILRMRNRFWPERHQVHAAKLPLDSVTTAREAIDAATGAARHFSSRFSADS